MVYLSEKRSGHAHRYFIDANTNESVCLCGSVKGEKEKRFKYHNHSSIYNNISYHSALEARYAAELDYRLKAKDIVAWERQIRLDLKVNGQHINNYYIDFLVYHKDGSREYVEVKGMELEPWKTNWKIFEATFEDFKKHPDDRMTVIKATNVRRR